MSGVYAGVDRSFAGIPDCVDVITSLYYYRVLVLIDLFALVLVTAVFLQRLDGRWG